MKIKVYINGIAGISAQAPDAVFNDTIVQYPQNIIPAVSPNYKEFIPAAQLRRMSKGIKMGLTAAKMALSNAGITMPDAIVTGTGEGCKQDTEKFLQAVLDQEEKMLSPTSFIQSTHNTIGGQIALNLKCTGYNMTYSQNSASLESAFIDALLLLQENDEIKNVLAGGVDEISEKITSFQELDGQVKKEKITGSELLKSTTPGTVISEGAHFFSISSEKTNASYAQLVDVSTFNARDPEEVSEALFHFLKQNECSTKDPDLVILGNNGDSRYDHFYHSLQKGIFASKPQLAFKHVTGDYETVTGFAVNMASEVLRRKEIPQVLRLNAISFMKLEYILIYNQYLGENHSFILLKAS